MSGLACWGNWLLLLLWSAEPAAAEGVKVSATELPAAVARPVDFTQEILPILRDRCWSCHGSETWEAGLRLDRKEQALRGGDSGPAIVIGKGAESRLLQYVAGLVPDKRMPPDEEPLSVGEISLLRGWIDQGASWPADMATRPDPARLHWAFQPVAAVSPPQQPEVFHPVDALINARLQHEGIAPSPPAERPQLIRRLSLDLLGLLPTAEEIAEFRDDPRPDAYERLVDRLLSSPHYGERWGRHWLDLARYADSDGYEKDLPRPFAYRYRDWVIDALNQDLPFDQFTIEQLAGDLLPEATLDQRVATGFHRQTLTNREGGIDPREDRDKQLVDRTNTTGAVWLGLTVGCAQCHTHKYDPITQREYFQLYAFFDTAIEQDIPAPTAAELDKYQRELQRHQARLQPLQTQWEQSRGAEFQQRLLRWQQRLQAGQTEWQPLGQAELSADSAKAQFVLQSEGRWLVQGEVPDVDTYTVRSSIGKARPNALLLETLPHPELPQSGPGRAGNGNFVLTQISVQFHDARQPKSAPVAIPLTAAQADFVQRAGTPQAFPPAQALNSDPKTGWAISGAIGQPHAFVVELDWPATLSPETEGHLVIRLEQRYGRQHVIGHFRLSLTTAETPLVLPFPPVDLAEVLAVPPGSRSAEAQRKLEDYYASLDPELRQLTAKIASLDATAPKSPSSRAMVLVARPERRATHVHFRGDFLSPGPEVQPAVFDVLNPLIPGNADSTQSADSAPTRLDLARWLVSLDNPLTRRVTVNRVWQHLFGRGLVDPPDDFGLRGTPPTHPELLDWLATEFSRNGWSQKALIRTIVTSAAYQRASQGRPDLVDVDPKNLWLSHQNRFRLSGEILRDISLNVSGLLNDRVGGPSVRPPLPAGVAAVGYANSVKWADSKGGDRYRRGCYIFFQRTVPYPLLMTFDGPDGNASCLRRERSNTPLQSLTLLNDPAFVECAQALGQKLLREGGTSTSDRLAAAIRWTLGREPQGDELGVLAEIHSAAEAHFQSDAAAATELLGAQNSEGLPFSELAVWTTLARVLLNVDEFLNRE